jgi:two-component system, NarL family, nitrate/nitrite response regulator NarL
MEFNMTFVSDDIRIGLADDHAIVREGLIRVLRKLAHARVVFEAKTAETTVRLAIDHEPDLLIVDLGMEGGGLNAIREISEKTPDVRCVVFTASEDPMSAITAMSLGAKGYILKGIGSDELVGALKAVLNDQSYVSPEFAMKLVTAATAGREAEHANRYLNVREVQVITEVEKGLTNRQIAERLKISEQTVKYYMTSLMQKYGVTNRTLAVLEHRKHATH